MSVRRQRPRLVECWVLKSPLAGQLPLTEDSSSQDSMDSTSREPEKFLRQEGLPAMELNWSRLDRALERCRSWLAEALASCAVAAWLLWSAGFDLSVFDSGAFLWESPPFAVPGAEPADSALELWFLDLGSLESPSA